MDLRLALHDTAARHGLDAAATTRLEQLAGLGMPAPGADADATAAPLLARRITLALALLAATLLGLGTIFWVAANWGTLGRGGRFALLQGALLTTTLLALASPRTAAAAAAAATLRPALALLAWLGTGALLAFFGQTYQTGADAWQLFALWAALTLPLCLGHRSPWLWAPWALVAMTAVALWVQTHTGHRWRAEPQDLAAQALGWAAGLAIVGALALPLRRHGGADAWALRLALALWVAMVVTGALATLFAATVGPQLALGLLLLALLAALLARHGSFDLAGLCAATLGLNILLVGGLTRWLFGGGGGGDSVGRLLLLGLVASGLLAASVTLLLRLARAQAARDAAAGVA